MWRFEAAAAVTLATPVVLSNVGEYEGADVRVVPPPVALILGAALGAVVPARLTWTQ